MAEEEEEEEEEEEKIETQWKPAQVAYLAQNNNCLKCLKATVLDIELKLNERAHCVSPPAGHSMLATFYHWPASAQL